MDNEQPADAIRTLNNMLGEGSSPPNITVCLLSIMDACAESPLKSIQLAETIHNALIRDAGTYDNTKIKLKLFYMWSKLNDISKVTQIWEDIISNKQAILSSSQEWTMLIQCLVGHTQSVLHLGNTTHHTPLPQHPLT